MACEKIRIACRLCDSTEALFDGTIEEPSLEFTEAAHMRLSNLLAAPPLVDFLEYGLGELIHNLPRQRDRRGSHDGQPQIGLSVVLGGA